MKAKISLLIILLFPTLLVLSQTSSDSTLVRIEMVDGNEFLGEVVNEDAERVYLKTENLGELPILKSSIKSREIAHVSQIKDGKLWFANPQSTRYFWSPNGY